MPTCRKVQVQEVGAERPCSGNPLHPNSKAASLTARSAPSPLIRSPQRVVRGEPIIGQIATADVKMDYRFNTCTFGLTNHGPSPGDSRHRCQLTERVQTSPQFPSTSRCSGTQNRDQALPPRCPSAG